MRHASRCRRQRPTDARRHITTTIAAAVSLSLWAPAAAGTGVTALAQANAAYAKVDDYRMTIAVHEVDGSHTEDKIYKVLFKKPSLERVDVIAGPDKGAGLVWLGGETVKAHHGGFLSPLRLTLNLHSRLVATLRGDSIDTTTVPAMLGHFSSTPGNLSEAPGPTIGDEETVAITLDVADATTDNGLTREVLYVSTLTHFPLRRENYVGTQVVKRLDIKQIEINVGLTTDDFPW